MPLRMPGADTRSAPAQPSLRRRPRSHSGAGTAGQVLTIEAGQVVWTTSESVDPGVPGLTATALSEDHDVHPLHRAKRIGAARMATFLLTAPSTRAVPTSPKRSTWKATPLPTNRAMCW